MSANIDWMKNYLYDEDEDQHNLPASWPAVGVDDSQDKYKDDPLYPIWEETHGRVENILSQIAAEKTSIQNCNAFSLLEMGCQALPDKPALLWLDRKGRTESTWTYRDLMDKIRSVAYTLQQKGVGPGDRVVCCFPPGLDFYAAFWACLALEVVAVPVCPPDPFCPLNDVGRKLRSIIADCTPALVLTNQQYCIGISAGRAFLTTQPDHNPALDPFDTTQEWVSITELYGTEPSLWKVPASDGDCSNGLAFLQYTSGSTGSPKGVRVTHANLIRNLYNCINMTHSIDSFLYYKHSVAVSWLPSFHDMGMIGFHVALMVAGATVVGFSPIDFIQNPPMWLKVLSRFKRAVTGGPPFALDLCVRKVKAKDMEEIDLRRVAGLVIGAEPIRYHGLEAFASKFGPCGFRREAFLPCYGLAENVLFALGKRSDTELCHFVHADPEALKRQKIVLLPESDPAGSWLVSSGERSHAAGEAVVIVVNPASGQECEDGSIGEIWITGDSKADGYWNRPQATEETFGGRLGAAQSEQSKKLLEQEATFIRTGDMGAFKDNQLFVTGRFKDTIILNGVNLYPHDIEDCITDHCEDVKKGSVVAIAVKDSNGIEQLAIFAELRDEAATQRRDSACHKLSRELVPMVMKSLPTWLYIKPYQAYCWTRAALTSSSSSGAPAANSMHAQYGKELDQISSAIRTSVLATFGGVAVYRTILLSPGAVKKTSSGKIRRSATLEAWHKNELVTHVVKEYCRDSLPGQALAGQPATQIEASVAAAEVQDRILQLVLAEIGDELEEEQRQLLVDGDVDPDVSLDQYGLNSVTATVLAGRLTEEFSLQKPLSVFMFISEPTLNGVTKVVMKLMQEQSTPISLGSSKAGATEAHIPFTSSSQLPHILGIGCAAPELGGPQELIVAAMSDTMGLQGKRKDQFAKIGANCRVSTRHTVMTDPYDLFWGKKGLDQDEGMDKRNERYKQEAPKLALKAAKKALADWGGDKGRLTHVVSVTCTGMIVPGIEFHVATGLDLDNTVQRLSITFMGCFGALAGLKTARALACSDPNNRILVVCCELCSLHLQMNDKIDNLIASSIFSDGCGAFVVGARPLPQEQPIFQLHKDASAIIPNTLSMMGWELSSTGFVIGLHKDIPSEIYKHIKPFCDKLMTVPHSSLGDRKVPLEDCQWAIHPGGAMIIQAICDVVGIEEPRADAAWEVLKDYGNMSSATLVFVWDRLRKKKLQQAWVPALAFGPGLNVEGALLRACN